MKDFEIIMRPVDYVVGGRQTAQAHNRCMPAPIGCGEPAEHFDDETSRREYRISGLCQKCQNAIFG